MGMAAAQRFGQLAGRELGRVSPLVTNMAAKSLLLKRMIGWLDDHLEMADFPLGRSFSGGIGSASRAIEPKNNSGIWQEMMICRDDQSHTGGSLLNRRNNGFTALMYIIILVYLCIHTYDGNCGLINRPPKPNGQHLLNYPKLINLTSLMKRKRKRKRERKRGGQ